MGQFKIYLKDVLSNLNYFKITPASMKTILEFSRIRKETFPDPQTAATMSEIILQAPTVEEKAFLAMLANLPLIIRLYVYSASIPDHHYSFSDYFNEIYLKVVKAIPSYDPTKSKITTFVGAVIYMKAKTIWKENKTLEEREIP
ncbi:MAG: hypothetical protein D6687_00015, partial [Acidobacteria bacterium]